MRGPHCRPGSVGTPSCRRGCLKETFNRAITLLTYPGISVIHHSRVACQSAQGHCLHDATEGGLVTGFREVARASGLGLAVVTYGIDRPIILGSMLGEGERDRLVLTGGAQDGDSIVGYQRDRH